MTATALGFLISFVSWVFPLLSIALLSYALALHSKKDTGAVRLFFAAFATFCRNVLILIDYGTGNSLNSHQYLLFLDLVLLLAMALAVMGSRALLSAQGIDEGRARRRSLTAIAIALWFVPAISGLMGILSPIQVLRGAVYGSSVLCLAWIYVAFGLMAGHHFGRDGRVYLRFSYIAAGLALASPFLRMFAFEDAIVRRATVWWWVEVLLMSASTTLLALIVIFVVRGARKVSLRSLLTRDLRTTRVISKRVFGFIILIVLTAMTLSTLLIRRSGEELTATMTKELQFRQMSELQTIGSRLQNASETLRSCVQGLALSNGLTNGDSEYADSVFSAFSQTANTLLMCATVVIDKNGEIIRSNRPSDSLGEIVSQPELASFAREALERGDSVAGPAFLGLGLRSRLVVFYCPTDAAGKDTYERLPGAYILVSSGAMAARFLRVPGGANGETSLTDEDGNRLLSSESESASGKIGPHLGIPPESEAATLSLLMENSPRSTVLRTRGATKLLAYRAITLGRKRYSLIASTPWKTVLSTIDTAYLKQYQLLGFIMFLVLFGSGTAIAVSTRWGRSLERVMQKRTEQLLHEKVNFEQALRSIGNPLILVNEELDITYANAEFISAFKTDGNAKCFDAVFHRDTPCEECLAQEAIRTDAVCHAVRTSLDNREERCFDITVSPKKDEEGNVLGASILLNDITERNALERKIRESEEKYKRLVETSPDMVCILQNGTLLYANRVLMDKLGYSPQRLFSRDFKLMEQSVHPDSREDAQNHIESLECGKPAKEVELCLLTRGGEELQTLCKGVHITYEGQSAVELILVDITNLKQLHSQLLEAERHASLGELTASIAHELNNKLAPILAYSQLLREKVEDEQMLQKLSSIEKCALGAKSVMESLLAFSRKSSPLREYVDLNKTMNDTIQLVKYRLDACNIDLILELDPKLPLTMADPKQIEQVFLNIMNNAYQAMEERGGTLYIISFIEGSTICFNITDTGPGISEKNQLKIFNPFFTTKPSGKGTGLGLSCSYGIIQAHNGEIKCKSKLGRGTTFAIYLPVVEGEITQKRPESKSQAPLAKTDSARILVVDDEEVLREMMTDILSEDHIVFGAGEGREAIRLLEEKSIDMIVMDIRMPGLDGFAIYKWVKENKPLLIRRILFTTGDIYEPKTRAFVKQAEVTCIPKPFSVNTFMKQVNSILNG
ncbi:response regulator [bacterium]|nr:response regulator [bacterium]